MVTNKIRNTIFNSIPKGQLDYQFIRKKIMRAVVINTRVDQEEGDEWLQNREEGGCYKSESNAIGHPQYCHHCGGEGHRARAYGAPNRKDKGDKDGGKGHKGYDKCGRGDIYYGKSNVKGEVAKEAEAIGRQIYANHMVNEGYANFGENWGYDAGGRGTLQESFT